MAQTKFLFLLIFIGITGVLHAGLSDLAGVESFEKISPADFNRLKADQWQVAGKNIIVKGHVYLPIKNLEIYADQMVVNTENRDFEAAGNIQLYRWVKVKGDVTLERLAELQKMSDCVVRVNGVSGDMWGDFKVQVEVSKMSDHFSAGRVAGNLESGYFRFDDLQARYSNFVCRAKSGERLPSGVITVKDAEISACEYLMSNNSHYSFAASEAKLTPHAPEFYGIKDIERNPGQYSVGMRNSLLKVYGVPLLWLPYFYKPKDQSPGLFRAKWGKNGDWGFFINVSKTYDLYDYPAAKLKLMGDFYERRGFGYGADLVVETEKSRLEAFAYSIYDRNPDYGTDYSKYRIDVPHARYEFRLTNLTHLTPTLDFRSQFVYMSDPYFERDFFSRRYDSNPRPATYVALEKEFEYLSAAVYARFQVNNFFSTVEKLPEVRIDIPRTSILNTGLYYQGNVVLDNFRMRWQKFDDPPIPNYPDSKLEDYEAFRADTTHFLYYPIKNKFFNFVPRAGFKVTGYSKTSKHKVTNDDLIQLFSAADPEGTAGYHLNNYDTNGGSDCRFAGELGFELSTKLHNSWQNLRSYFLNMDGLRHVARPYINYTYINSPTVNRDYLLYFDDTDRLDRQNFIRLGVENRFQTRSGNGVKNLFSMENFWDYHFQEEDGYSRAGEFGTKMKWEIFRGLTLDSTFLIDTGNNNEDKEVERNGRLAGYPGLSGIKCLNQLKLGLTYSPAADYSAKFSYTFDREYRARSAYSMGSTLTQLDAGSYFDRYLNEQTEEFTLGFQMPLTPDHRTLGGVSMDYDVRMGRLDNINLTVQRKFHCFSLIGTLGFESDTDDGDKTWDVNYSFQINLDSLNAPMNGIANDVLRGGNQRFSSSDSFF